MKECKHLIKYTSNPQMWTCGLDQKGSDGKAHCGVDVQTGAFILYRNCSKYEPIEKKKLSIAESILRDIGFKEE